MMFSTLLALVFGIIGIVKDRPRWLAIVIAVVSLLLMSPWVISVVSACT